MDISVSNIPLVIQYDDGTEIDKITSDENGIAKVFVRVISPKTEVGSIIAKLNPSSFHSMYKKHIKRISAVATFKIIENEPIAFSVHIVDEKNNKIKTVETMVSKSVEKQGYSISESAKLSLEGKIEIIDSKEIEGKDGLQHLIRSELSLFLKVKSTGEKIASYETTGKGLSKKSETDALKKSYKKLKLRKKALSEMLSEAEGALEKVFENKSNENYKKAMFYYNQGEFKNSIECFSKVTHGVNVDPALEKIRSVQKQLIEIEEARLKKIQEGKDKLRD